MRARILLIEDDTTLRSTISRVLQRSGYEVLAEETGRAGMDLFRNQNIDLVLLDLRLPDGDGFSVFEAMKAMDDEVPVVFMTAFPDAKVAVSAMKAGAHDYIIKPFELSELKLVVQKGLEISALKTEVQRLRHEARPRVGLEQILGEHPSILRVKDLIRKVAQSPHTPVLIRGESGTGKELVADAIHDLSHEAPRPLVKVNCSAIPETLLEAELFGYERGAYTGAQQAKKGVFELADGGTLFLDEIGEMPERLQPKLLRILEEHTLKRIGGTRQIRVSLRVLAATNRDLGKLMEVGRFRKDLYYRLNVMEIVLPPLRERREDIPLLAQAFLESLSREMGKSPRTPAPETIAVLRNYAWPGNVRELKNVIERAVILAEGEELKPETLPQGLEQGQRGPGVSEPYGLEGAERNHILSVLAQVGGNRSEAARRLGISRSTLKEKLKKYQLPEESLPL
jgi:DNA-binding NtrC family response regulator